MSEATNAGAGGGEAGGHGAAGGGAPSDAPVGLGGGQQWTPTHDAVRAEMHAARASMYRPDGSEDIGATTRYRECASYLYDKGPMPKHMKPAGAGAAAGEPAIDPASEFSHEFAREHLAYQPAERPDAYHLELGEGSTVGDMQAIRGFLHTIGLSKRDGEAVWREVVRLDGEPLTDADRAEGAENLRAILQSAWKDQFDANVKSAERAWNRLPQATRDQLEADLGAAIYSPLAWHALARAGRVG